MIRLRADREHAPHSVPFYPSDKRAQSARIPARKTSSLHDHGIVIRPLHEIMEYRPGPAIVPAPDLAEAKVVEHQPIFPMVNGIISLCKSQQMEHVVAAAKTGQ